jgi:hypothetical protein
MVFMFMACVVLTGATALADDAVPQTTPEGMVV